MSTGPMRDPMALMGDLIARARAAGADAADAVLIAGTSLSVQRRLGQTEHLERSEGRDLGLRVFVGRRSAIVSSTAVDPAGFAALAERAVDMARVVPEDPYGGLADEAAPVPALDLDLVDPAEPDAPHLIAAASAAEEAAMAVSGVTNSEGGSAGYSRTEVVLVTSAGFAGRTMRTGHSISATALAGSGTAMQRDYDYSSAVHLADLEDPATIGRTAGERAVARMNPTRPKTGRLPVVFDPRVASSLLGHLVGAINGAGVARGTSFLKDSMGQRVFPAGITIIDDPHRHRGLRSRLFDGEGVPGQRRELIADGVLTTWLLDSRSARQLGLKSTGHAGARHRRPALARADQPLPRRRHGVAGRPDGRHPRGALRHRDDRHGRQRRHRGLQPRCGRIHDPQRRARRAGGRDHHRRHAAGDVRRAGGGRRPEAAPRHGRADAAGYGDDTCRKLIVHRIEAQARYIEHLKNNSLGELTPMRRFNLFAALAALALVLAPALADAKAGRGGSFGSRGSRTFVAPPATTTAPRTAAPMQRSTTQPGTPAPGVAGQAARPGLFGGGMMGGFMGGLIGAGLIGMLFGGSLFAGGFMGFLGMLLQFALIAMLVSFAVRWFRSRNQAAAAGGAPMPRTMDGAAMGGLGRAMGGGAAPSPASRPLEIGPADYQAFEATLHAVQAAWSAGNEGALRRHTSPEMAAYFGEELSDMQRQGLRNRITDVKLEQGDLAEAWTEQGQDYATVAMRFSSLDVTRDASGRVVDGDAATRSMTTEVWTFTRSPGEDWVLSAIQQAG